MKPPWTDDPILQRYRFCNVMRRHDKVSIWIIKHVLSRSKEMDILPFLQLVALGRWINWPPTLEAILKADGLITRKRIDFDKIVSMMHMRRSAGDKVWTGAYMIRAPSERGGYPDYTKPEFVLEMIDNMKTEGTNLEIALCFNSVKAITNALMTLPNFGSFMSGQIAADLTYTEHLNRANDLYTWAPMGPGSRRGYNRMLGLPLKHPVPTEEVWCTTLQRWRQEILEAIEPANPFDFTLHDVQNCLCETDKYLRVQNGEGRPRAVYAPHLMF